MTLDELKGNIINELLNSNKITIGEKISYNKFFSLYSIYNHLPEFYFAKILGISYYNFINFKQGKNKAYILKNFDFYIFKDIVLNYVRENFSKNAKICYSDFLSIANAFPFLNINHLAELLGIKISRLQNIKYNNKKYIIINKEHPKISKDENKIINDLISRNIIYPGMQIDYLFFKTLKKTLPEFDEIKLAQMLEINLDSLKAAKSKKYNLIILKSKIEEYIINNRNNILYELFNYRNCFVNEKINYVRFLELYSGFNHFNEVEFSRLILNINYNSFMAMKHNNKKAVILKNYFNFNEHDCTNFFNEICVNFNISEGKKINYEVFLNIYEEYKFLMSKENLAEILGINERLFHDFKNKNCLVTVLNGVNLQKSYFIKSLFLSPCFYSKDFIEEILQNYNITIEDFVNYILNKNYFFPNKYVEAFYRNNGLFIGKSQMSNWFFNENYNEICENIKYILYDIEFKISEYDDRSEFFQSMLMHAFETCGDLEYNFGNSKYFYIGLKNRVRKFILILLAKEKTLLYSAFHYEELKFKDLSNTKLLEDNTNVEEAALSSIQFYESFYEKVVFLIDCGYSLTESLNYLSNIYKKTVSDLYQELKKQAELQKRKIKKTREFELI